MDSGKPTVPHLSKHKGSRSKDADRKSKRHHRHHDEDDAKPKKRRKSDKVQIIDDDLDDEDMWAEKNIDMDGDRVRRKWAMYISAH
jgi:hypothetical protein